MKRERGLRVIQTMEWDGLVMKLVKFLKEICELDIFDPRKFQELFNPQTGYRRNC